MWRYGGLSVLVLAATAGTVWSQEYPEGTQDGPCPDIGFKKGLKWKRLAGKWNEIMRFNSTFEPHQCPASHTYAGNPPNITNFLSFGGSDDAPIPRHGVIDENDPNKIVFPNIFGSEPAEFTRETIYTNYRNIHVFQICQNLEGDKHLTYVWIETREGTKPSPRKINTQLRRLQKLGIDTSRFWKLDLKHC